MASYTVTAFKWSGTGYNSVYHTSHSATLRDDDGAYEGYKDSDERISIDNGPETTTHGRPYSIDVSFTDTAGNPHVETFSFFNTDGSWYFIPGDGSAFSEGATLGMYQSHTVGWNYKDVACFAGGTLIDTENGPVAVENLEPGAAVRVLDGSLRPLRFCLQSDLSAAALRSNPHLRPVRVVRGALGHGLPLRDLRISRQHRMLVSSRIARRMFGVDQVLIPAVRLTGLPGCFIEETPSAIAYFHLVFDRHEVVFANGTPSESFYFAGADDPTMPPQTRQEEPATLFGIAPDKIGDLPHARLVPPPARQRQLITRHRKNDKPFVCKSLMAHIQPEQSRRDAVTISSTDGSVAP